MNPPQVLVKTCLTTHLYTQEKDFFSSEQAEGISVFCLFTHAAVNPELSITSKTISEIFSTNVEFFWKEVSVLPTLFTRKQTGHTHCYCRQRGSPTCMLQLWKTHLHLLSAQTTTNKLRDFRDYSTFSLYSSKKITHQDQLPTSFSFFWLKGQEESFKSLEFLYFPVKFLLDEKTMNWYSSSIIVYVKLLLQSKSLSC